MTLTFRDLTLTLTLNVSSMKISDRLKVGVIRDVSENSVCFGGAWVDWRGQRTGALLYGNDRAMYVVVFGLLRRPHVLRPHALFG